MLFGTSEEESEEAMSNREPPTIGLAKCCLCQVTQVNVCDDYMPEAKDENK